ncbi:MAG: DUF4382 domain-containing protein, partial [Thermoflexibacteraceae bacterium]
MKTKWFWVLPLISTGVFLNACTANDSTSSNVPFEVRMTDSPGEYSSVKIDLLRVEVKISEDNDDSKGWQVLKNVKPGVYDLLELTNGKDVLIATDAFPVGTISQLRLILGDNNSVTTQDGQTVNMKTPSAQTAGLKLKINATLQAGITYKLLLDFDASRSIVKTGNGRFNLKPVIRAIAEAQSGAIKGVVTPAESQPAVWAISSTDSIGTYADTNGNFLIKGVPAATYRVSFAPKTPFKPRNIDGVTVNIG